MGKSNLLWLLALVVFAACEKPETPVAPHEPGDLMTRQLVMGSDYSARLFYDIETDSVVFEGVKTDFDLMLETGIGGWHVLLNGGKLMAAAPSGKSFEATQSSDALQWDWDRQSGSLDSTALGDWREEHPVYVLDRGYDNTGSLMGFVKLQVMDVQEGVYTIHWGALDATTPNVVTVDANTDARFVGVLLEGEGSDVEIEPASHTWDIVFTQYTHVFYVGGDTTPYLVNGVLHNTHGAQSLMDSSSVFDDYTRSDAEAAPLTDAHNAIGYNYKWFDFDAGSFLIRQDRFYVVRSVEQRLFKMRFIDFYTSTGEKGAPAFEFAEL